MRIPALALAVLVAAAFVWSDPAQTLGATLVERLVIPGAIALAWGAGAGGAGGALLRWRAPDVLDGPSGWLYALGAGIALQSAGMFVLAVLGQATPLGCAGLLAALACGWIARPAVPMPRSIGTVAALVGAVFLLPGLIEALAPPTDTDELYQHLALARRISESGTFLGGFAHPDGSRPLPVHLLLASLYALGGETAPRLWHLGLVAALVAGVRELAEARFGSGRGTLPALALLGSWSFVREAGMAGNNHAVALWLLLAAEAMLRRRWSLMAWMCGIALAGKYTAAPAVAGMVAIALFDGPRRGAVLAGLLLPVLPWWGRNLFDGLHPLFPFAGWPRPEGGVAEFIFMYPEKYGAGRAPLDWLLLPWNMLMRAEPDSFVFLGRISLLWAPLLGAGLWRSRPDTRRLAVVVLAGIVGWALGPQLFRYLLPLSGIAALMGGALSPGWPALLLWLAALPANVAPAWERAAGRIAVARGAEDRAVFLEREVSAWPALTFLREHVPPDAEIALLYAWHGYYVDQPYVLGSVEDHVPTRWWLWSHGDAALADLSAAGVTHLLVGDVRSIRKSYPFLSPAVLRAQFTEPEERLRELLLRDATRLFAANRWELWRLDAAGLDAPAPAP